MDGWMDGWMIGVLQEIWVDVEALHWDYYANENYTYMLDILWG
jgi:hypothetical protein